MIRTSILFSLASLTVLLAACDVDEPSVFRCGTPCVNSPYLGVLDITNQSLRPGVDAIGPDGQLSVRWTAGVMAPTKTAIDAITVSPHGAASVALATGQTVPIVGARFDLTVTRGDTSTSRKLWFADATTEQGDEDPTFTITRYDIRTDVDPGADHEDFGRIDGESWWSICPTIEGGSNLAVLLPATHADADGGVGWVALDDGEYAIACDGHSLAKGLTELNVVPRAGGARGYGHARYSSLMQGWQAVFAGESRTFFGAEVGIRDAANDPPLFDTLDSLRRRTPAAGEYEWILESVYRDTGDEARGAQCKFTTHPLRPLGAHRNPAYDPPVDLLSGWRSLPECSGDPSRYGDVAFYSLAPAQSDGSQSP